jgi:Vitamin K-dependent gamma-carboxylase
MNKPIENTVLPRWMGSWERFWFTPMDPTPLALIRVACGLIVLYTFVIYSFCLPEFMGAHAWVDLELRQQFLRDRPTPYTPLGGTKPVARARTPEQERYLERYKQMFKGMDLRTYGLAPPETEQQWNYLVEYTKRWNQPPPLYAESAGEAARVDAYIKEFKDAGVGMDPRIGGLRLPQNDFEDEYLKKYIKRWGAPPPDYAKNTEEADAIHAYMEREGYDPRLLYARGMPTWSIWMHVVDERWMACVQALFVLSALLFTLGLGTRVTAPLTWIASLCYLHRNAQVMFGADTMINILLLYLTIGPSGAALSLDRVLARWWRGQASPPAPRVTANLAIRLLQIHVCIVYFMAGIAKLQGASWWNGSAIWSVVANFEFAPMHIGLYNDVLRFIARDELLLQAFSTFGCYFTLTFEIGYPFLIWLPRTRWVYLGFAILLHGTIGMFMGLKTFSMVMLVMNMAFLRPEEVRWMLGWMLGWFRRPRAVQPAAAPKLEAVAR